MTTTTKRTSMTTARKLGKQAGQVRLGLSVSAPGSEYAIRGQTTMDAIEAKMIETYGPKADELKDRSEAWLTFMFAMDDVLNASW